MGQSCRMKTAVTSIAALLAVLPLNAMALPSSPIAPPTPAIPVQTGNWVTDEDFRNSRSNGGGTTVFELALSETGAIDHCRVTQSSGHDQLDILTCALLAERGRFRPAKDQHGRPIASLYSNRVHWGGESAIMRPPADVSLTVAKLPWPYSSPARAHVVAVVGPQGTFEACVGDGRNQSVLDNAACKYLAPIVAPASRRTLVEYTVEFLVARRK